MLQTEKIKNDFPILKRKVNGKKLVYLDNAATSQKPVSVINAITDYYSNHNANVHRGVHRLSEEASSIYESAHDKAAEFIGASSEEIIFTKNSTESLNLVAYSLSKLLGARTNVVTTLMEHHSNILPWQNVFFGKTFFTKVTHEGKIDLDDFSQLMKNKPGVVAFTHASNVLGTINPVKEMVKIAHESGAIAVVDGAQSTPHMPVNVKNLGADFYVFSSHKMLGPTGIGVLYGKKELLEKMPPFLYGGDMIKSVSVEKTEWNDLPWKFEAGTPNIAGAAGFSSAIDYLKRIGMKNIHSHESELVSFALKELSQINGIKIFGPKTRGGLLSFSIKGIHPHDVASILDMNGVAVRSGYHCAEPLVNHLCDNPLTRASFYLYNDKNDVIALKSALEKVEGVLE